MNWTEEEVALKLKDNPDLQLSDPLAKARARVYEILKKRTSKYCSRMTEYNRVLYHSKKEADFALNLDYQKAGKAILYWLRQVPFLLPDGIVYRVDFQVFYPNGEVRYYDVKGFDTPVSKLKRRQVEATYPVIIEIV